MDCSTHAAALCIAFCRALAAWRFFNHMVYGALNWATRTVRPARRSCERPRSTRRPGSRTWDDLAWHDLLQADACTTCGRCNAVCPAEAAGKPLHPRSVVLGLRAAVDGRDDRPGIFRERPGAGTANRKHECNLASFAGLTAPTFPNEAIWSCTTCGACNEACPVGIEVFDKIVELRRGRVETGIVPVSAEEVFESTAGRSNPFGKPEADRLLWAAGLDVPGRPRRREGRAALLGRLRPAASTPTARV